MSKTDVRREAIMQSIRTKGSISVAEIVNQFDCSEATARRDLEYLESEKRLIRTFGGAILEETKPEIPFYKKLEHQVQEKMEIAAKAAEMIEDGDTVSLTGGSTTHLIARKLRGTKRVTVVTNAINIAHELAGVDGLQVIVTGGVLRGNSFELSGPMADSALSKIIIQKMFLGADGISLQRGITTYHELEANTNRVMMQSSLQKYVVVDHTKFDKSFLFMISDIKSVNGIITDNSVDKLTKENYKQAGVHLI